MVFFYIISISMTDFDNVIERKKDEFTTILEPINLYKSHEWMKDWNLKIVTWFINTTDGTYIRYSDVKHLIKLEYT